MTQRLLIATALVSLAGCSGGATETGTSPDEGAIGVSRNELRRAAGGAVFTQTNEAEGNRVLAFARDRDGSLASPVPFATGGVGSGDSLGSQGALVLTGDGKHLLVVNAGSNDVSVFDVDGARLTLDGRFPSGGARPISVSERGGVVVVLNAGGDGNVAASRLDGKGRLHAVGPARPLSGTSVGPAQVQISPDGRVAAVTEKASNEIDTYRVSDDGRLGNPEPQTSAGTTPYGFDFTNDGVLIVSEAATTSVSSYTISRRDTLSAVSSVVSDTQAAPCWLTVSRDDRFAFVANAGSSSISSYSVGRSGSVRLVDARAGDTGEGSHPLDMAIDDSGSHLYVLDRGASVLGFDLGRDGSLDARTSAGSLTQFAAGIAAY